MARSDLHMSTSPTEIVTEIVTGPGGGSGGTAASFEVPDGTVLRPGDVGYDVARSVWNAMVDHAPALIARCASVRDVVAAVRAARERDLEIGVRCGGHSVLGHAVPDGGLMIDLTPMGAVHLDPGRRRAWVQGGALLGALDRAAQVHGLATTAGNVSHTGVGGLTLGGGMGWLARRYGLACDNVVSYELVTAEGKVVRASATEHPDLFWGLNGGGGNFGIVTEFEFRLHPIGRHALTVDLLYPLDQGVDVLRRWRDLNAEAPREATFTAMVTGDGVLSVGYVWVGEPAAGRALIPAIRSVGRPREERIVEQSYIQLQTRNDDIDGYARRRYTKGHYLRQFSDAAIEAFLLRGTPDGRGSFLPTVDLQAYGGAIADVPETATAFAHRDVMFTWLAGAGWTDPNEDGPRLAAARQAAAALDPHAAGVYVNALADEGAAGVRRAYPPGKLALLTRLKDAWDPDNTFHLNQNIPPTSTSGSS
jgi:FAD/FMN-containing dehydrogenase